MSLCTTPTRPMKNAVVAPTTSTTESAVSDNSNSGDMRATMKMPAVTMVAAWISAEMGVGPSMESGSHTCSGTWADLPMAPTNRRMQITVGTDQADTPQAAGSSAMLWPLSCDALANTSA